MIRFLCVILVSLLPFSNGLSQQNLAVAKTFMQEQEYAAKVITEIRAAMKAKAGG